MFIWKVVLADLQEYCCAVVQLQADDSAGVELSTEYCVFYKRSILKEENFYMTYFQNKLGSEVLFLFS